MNGLPLEPADSAGTVWDALVVGGGAAGLAAALVLGRYRRRTLVFDDGRPRNGAAVAIHGVPGLAGWSPAQFHQKAWEEIGAYPDVERRDHSVVRAERTAEGMIVLETEAGQVERGRRVLLATGVSDLCPDGIPGFRALYGSYIHHCPDCDGYQATEQKIGLICWGKTAAPYAMEFLNWTRDITILANGHGDSIPGRDCSFLGGWGIPVEPRRIAAIEGENGKLTRVRFDDGTTFDCAVLYFYLGQRPRNELAKQLGCKLNDQGHVVADRRQRASVSGVFVAGDLAPPDQTVAVAMAEGQVAAITINRSLYGADRWMG